MGSFQEAFASRYESMTRAARINTKTFTVTDLVAVYGSKKALAEAYAQERGVKIGSAQKAITRLERYERGERGGDVRNAAKVSDSLQKIAQSKLPSSSKGQVGGGGSGMGGGTLFISGTVGVAGYGDEYEEDRDIDQYLDADEADRLATLAFEQGEAAATAYFDGIYGFDNMYVVDADILFNEE